MRIGQIDIYKVFGSNMTSKAVWTKVSTSYQQTEPTSYLEQFRTINRQEFDCIKVSALRGRIPFNDPLFVTVGRLIQVSYSCNHQGITTCVILCRAADNTYLFTGVSRLNPIDSYNRKKGEALAFYRAVTESEAIILFTNLTEEK